MMIRRKYAPTLFPTVPASGTPSFISAMTFAGGILLRSESKVKQIIGGTMNDDPSKVRANFVSDRSSVWYAELYKRDDLRGGHIIKIGKQGETNYRRHHE